MSDDLDTGYNAADPRKVNERRKIQKAVQTKRDSAFVNLMSTPAGRSLVWAWLSDCGVYRMSHVRGDVVETAFNEGKRQFGLMLADTITRLTPEQYLPMVQEANQGELKNVG